MPKMPFGGFDAATLEMSKDDPWTKLATIKEHMEDGEPIPPYLAQWLALAIQYSNRNPNELLRRLGLKANRGRTAHNHADDAWHTWGGRLYDQQRRERPEAALLTVSTEYQQATGRSVERSQLQKWCAKYTEARDASRQ